MITDLRFFNGKLQYRATYHPGWFDVRYFDAPAVEEPKKEEPCHPENHPVENVYGKKRCEKCGNYYKPEEKRKKLAEIIREYRCLLPSRLSKVVLADLEKRIDEFVKINDKDFGEYEDRMFRDFKYFIRKEWLGE